MKPGVEPQPEVRPVGTIIKTVTNQKPLAEAVVKPALSSTQGGLVETGVEGTLPIGGAGILLLSSGAVVLFLRREQWAH